MSDSPPSEITGGCLCGAVRYSIPISKWPIIRHACSCTQCRKWSGAFISHFISNPIVNFTSSKQPSTYISTPGVTRGFCATCGSTLFWKSDKETETEITLGTVDEQFLIGEEARRWELCVPVDGRYYCEGDLVGVDVLGGVRHEKGSNSKVLE